MTISFLENVHIFQEIDKEMSRQDAKWGEQNLPDGTGGEEYKILARLSRLEYEQNADAGVTTWRDILAEDVHGAFAESDPERLKEELIQVAVVAIQWVACIERRKS